MCCIYAAGLSTVKPEAVQKENVVLFDLRCAADNADEVYRVFRGDLYRAFLKSDRYRRVSESDRDNALAGFPEETRKKITAADAAKVAVSCGAAYAIIGSVTKQDGTYRVTVQLLKAIDGEMVREYSESAVTISLLIEKIRPMVAMIAGVAENDVRPPYAPPKSDDTNAQALSGNYSGLLTGFFSLKNFISNYSPLAGAEYWYLFGPPSKAAQTSYLSVEYGMAFGKAGVMLATSSFTYYALVCWAPATSFSFRIENFIITAGVDISAGWLTEMASYEENNATNDMNSTTYLFATGGAFVGRYLIQSGLSLYMKIKCDYLFYNNAYSVLAYDAPLLLRISLGISF
ncbi:MAG: hypothetical protein HZC28_07235 [Spirochaetes bacterium]|nr:hypothetical protein [Spirochaetota bacterium]